METPSFKAMRKWSAYRNWVSPVTQERQYVKSQTDDILCIFHDLPFFFSQAGLKLIFGYISPNHNVTGALSLMVTNNILDRLEDSNRTTQYYLGHFARRLLKQTLPNIESKSEEYSKFMKICFKNGRIAINSRKDILPALTETTY